MKLKKDQILFKKDSDFNTIKEFEKDFPMFSKTRRSIPPFVIPNTVNGACIIFSTSDMSQFIYRLSSHSVVLLGPSEQLLENAYNEENEINFYWFIHNILKISTSYYNIDGTTYELSYLKNKYRIKFDYNLFNDGLSAQTYNRCDISIHLIK